MGVSWEDSRDTHPGSLLARCSPSERGVAHETGKKSNETERTYYTAHSDRVDRCATDSNSAREVEGREPEAQ